MAKIPSGERSVTVRGCVNGSVLPRKRYQATGFNIKERTYRRPKGRNTKGLVA